jgi:hypothetical protein
LVVGFKFKYTALKQGYFNFKRGFSPRDLNWIYFIEFKGIFWMEIGSKILVDLGQLDKEYFPKYLWAFLQGFENKTKAKMTYKMMKRLLMEWWN